MSLVFKLYRLQQVDSQLDASLARLREIEIALADDAKLVAAQTRARMAAEDLDEMQKILSQAEVRTQTQRRKIENSENTLYSGSVKNPKELEDLQNEAAALKRYLVVLEDRQLEAMLAVDEAKSASDEAESDLADIEAHRRAIIEELVSEQASLSTSVERLKSEREAATSGLPSEVLDLYTTMRGQRQGIAVARVIDKTCAACGSTLSAALLGEARMPNQISRCDFCGRILYAS